MKGAVKGCNVVKINVVGNIIVGQWLYNHVMVEALHWVKNHAEWD